MLSEGVIVLYTYLPYVYAHPKLHQGMPAAVTDRQSESQGVT